jgi:VWFA-related protein
LIVPAAAALALIGLSLSLAAIPLGVQEAASKQGPKSSPAAPAQNSATSEGKAGSSTRQTIRVTVGVVNVAVSVLDRKGIPVIGLGKSDFEVYEDGKRQAITYFGKEPPLPLRIGLVLDTSNSARTQLPFEKDAASEFVFAMLQGRSSRNQIFLQTFDATSSIIQDFVNDPEVLNEKIRGLKAGGGKALYDAIYFACREKMLGAGPPENTRRVLVLISDGRDVQSTHTLDEALSMAHKAGAVVYAIGNAAYGYANPTDKVLEGVAQMTGGAAFFPLRVTAGADLGTGYLSHGQIGDTSQNKGLGAETGAYSAQRLIQLADSLDAISRELNEQYTIGYTPANNVLDGTFRSIQIVALRKGVRVRSKPGYFATRE